MKLIHSSLEAEKATKTNPKKDDFSLSVKF